VTWTVIAGDVRDADFGGGFDAVLCDPPYELGFMGKRWDASGVAFDSRVWARVLAACKPGAPLMAFGGTRTYHRMTCAIEDAGFEIRDCLAWLYGSGFPKSLDVSKAIDRAAGAEREVVGGDPESKRRNKKSPKFNGRVMQHYAQMGDVPITAPATDAARAWQGYGTALKPAFEPCVLARVPLEGTVAANVTAHGCGALAIDAGRIEFEAGVDMAARMKQQHSDGIINFSKGLIGTDIAMYKAGGRWPANVLLDEQAAAMLDAQAGTLASGKMLPTATTAPRAVFGQNASGGYTTMETYGDTGGASRFFYTSKASRDDRDHGLLRLPSTAAERTGRTEGSAGITAYAGATGPARNPHPTVKPTDLTEYLARLILPPRRATPRRLLVPFAGSGSEMIGALRAGWDEVVGVELAYFDLARERLTSADTAHQRNLFGDT